MLAVGQDLGIAVACILVGIIGIITNGLLISLILFTPALRGKDYVRFIFNKALIDLIFCVLLATLHPIVILTTDANSNTCAAAGVFEVMLGLASVYSEPLLACNRYVSILKSGWYSRIYTKRNVYIMCTSSWVLAAITVIPHIFLKTLGRITGSYCSLVLSPDTLVPVLSANYSFMLIAFSSIVFFNLKMYLYLNKYQNQSMTNNERTQLQNDREILRFIAVAAFVPLLFQFPTAVVTFVSMITPLSGWIVFPSMSMFTIPFALSPLVTMLMVRPIRSQLLRRSNKIFGAQLDPAQQIQPIDGIAE